MATAQRDSFFIKLNPDEKAKWKKHAEEIGYNNISSMLREMVRESISGGKNGNELKDELLKIRREISAIGNNINQIAKHSNQEKTAHDIPDLSKIKKNIACELGINCPYEYVLAAIHRIIMLGNVAFIKILLDNGMDIEKEIVKEETNLLAGC